MAGVFLGFFGVIISVFADSALTEQLITISIILLIYMVLSGLLGFLLPKYSWQWGLMLGAPGVIFLGIYMLREVNLYYLIYMILIIGISSLSAIIGSKIRNKKKNSEV